MKKSKLIKKLKRTVKEQDLAIMELSKIIDKLIVEKNIQNELSSTKTRQIFKQMIEMAKLKEQLKQKNTVLKHYENKFEYKG